MISPKRNPAVNELEDLSVDLSISIPFSISQEDMQMFADMSGDYSRIHRDPHFAANNGFEGPVVYGALIVAKLSMLVGMHIPGDLGLATEWKINFHSPLYVDEPAVIRGAITHISGATRSAKIKFQVDCNARLIASGTAGSMLLRQ